MQYIKVQWLHDDPDFPVLLYSELDEDRWEIRKVDIYPDGRMEYADKDGGIGSTMLCDEMPIPPLEEIASDPVFVPEEIPQEEFERIWTKALEEN